MSTELKPISTHTTILTSQKSGQTHGDVAIYHHQLPSYMNVSRVSLSTCISLFLSLLAPFQIIFPVGSRPEASTGVPAYCDRSFVSLSFRLMRVPPAAY